MSAKRSYIRSVFSCRCPRCREGKLFKNAVAISLKKNMDMHVNCIVCGQPTEIEIGFYYGTGFVSYAMTVALSVLSFLAWYVTIGMSLSDTRFFWWLGFNAVLLLALQPWLMRLSRSVWISWFVGYDPEWQKNKIKPEATERIIAEQMNNW